MAATSRVATAGVKRATRATTAGNCWLATQPAITGSSTTWGRGRGGGVQGEARGER